MVLGPLFRISSPLIGHIVISLPLALCHSPQFVSLPLLWYSLPSIVTLHISFSLLLYFHITIFISFHYHSYFIYIIVIYISLIHIFIYIISYFIHILLFSIN